MINSYGEFPIIGILIGAAIAGITQSSSATTSLVIAMGSAGVIRLDSGIALIMGANIGTCFLELIAGFGATTPAKRTAIAQTIINIVGVAIFYPFIGPFSDLVATTATDLPRQIANAHTIFNVLVSLMFIPLVGLLVRFCEWLIPDKEGEVIGRHFFDDQMLNMPQVAMLEAEKEILRTADITIEMIQKAQEALLQGSKDAIQCIMNLEDEVDDRCRESERFIDLIKEEELSESDKVWRMKLLAIITDIERVGDLTQNIAEYAQEMANGISFSEEANTQMASMFDIVEKTYAKSIKALKTRNKEMAKQAEQMEDKVDEMERKLRTSHKVRMGQGLCQPEADTIFVETLRNLERIGDHADNIAFDVIMDY